MAAGAGSSILYGPVDLIAIHQQKMGLGPAATISHLCRTHGVLSLWRGIGDQKLFEMWLQDWDDKSDWSDLNGGNMVSFAQSLAKSDTGDDKVKPWAAAWAIATENGWKPPKWALPPREIDAASLTVDVTKMRTEMEKGLKP